MQRDDKGKSNFSCLTAHSTFEMRKSILQLEDFYKEMELTKFHNFKNLSEWRWKDIFEIVSVRIARKCTQKLQCRQLTLGLFYDYCQKCKLTTKKNVVV